MAVIKYFSVKMNGKLQVKMKRSKWNETIYKQKKDWAEAELICVSLQAHTLNAELK